MVILPDEIIFHIAKFVPDEFLKDLLGVSRVFYQIALDARYCEASLGRINDLQEIKFLSHILSEKLVGRVRTLNLNIHHDVSQSAALGEYNAHLQLLSTMIGLCANVKVFSVVWKNAALYAPLAERLLPIAWETFGSRLESLTIHMPLLQTGLLKHSNMQFQKLVELDLHFHTMGHRQQNDELNVQTDKMEDIGRTLSASAETLRKFRLKVATRFVVIGLPTFLSSMGRCPNLKEIEFSPNWSDTAFTSEFANFLYRSGTLLKKAEFRVRPGAFDADLGQPVALWLRDFNSRDSRALSQLENLALDASRSTGGWSIIKDVLRSCHTSLTNLELNHRTFTSSDLTELGDIYAVSNTSQPCPLRSLYIILKILTPKALYQLSKIPDLEELILAFTGVGDDEGNKGQESFATALNKYDFSKWKLKRILQGGQSDLRANYASNFSIPALLVVLRGRIPTLEYAQSTAHTHTHGQMWTGLKRNWEIHGMNMIN